MQGADYPLGTGRTRHIDFGPELRSAQDELLEDTLAVLQEISREVERGGLERALRAGGSA